MEVLIVHQTLLGLNFLLEVNMIAELGGVHISSSAQMRWALQLKTCPTDTAYLMGFRCLADYYKQVESMECFKIIFLEEELLKLWIYLFQCLCFFFVFLKIFNH